MPSVLLLVDGSENAMRAVRDFVDKRDWYQQPVDLHLLNVQLPIASGLVKSFISKKQLDDYYREEGLAALKQARALLDEAGVPYRHHIGVGELAATILDYADDKKSDLLVMGTHGRGAVKGALLGSVATRMLHQGNIPVLLVS
jgi:nucleotide-binding universal stress UspA family protein